MSDSVVPPPAGPPSGLLTESDREAVLAALTVHREAGRLSPTEFEARQVVASRARTWAEVGVLFGDLPAPQPQPRSGAPFEPGATAAAPGGVDWLARLAAATPIIALILFFVTKNWLWFLMVPLMWTLAKGPHRRS
ncbi:MAG: DUF1707 domain-containing protein [Kineosporiaceae bacterium]|nr:DUF1707 domain-containing protein [Kineosporiaceae bacterium]MBK8075990.1 DUF1707 domain-containing protein [Kineosporiaceae bacterium]